MGANLVHKIIAAHLVSGDMTPGAEIAISIDQTLTQDATGTMAYLQFEAMGRSRVETKLSVSYVDHNMLQTGFENADDHRYLESVAAKYGLHFSRPGNGICHQVHIERFARPGETLLGADSHTPTAGGVGMLAIGAGGLDVAVAMAGGPYYLTMPQVVLVRLTGRLRPWVSAKDVIFELLRRLTVRGGVGRVFEYGGPGVAALSIPDRATITNMGAELGATTSLFPSDETTRAWMEAQQRPGDWTPLAADPDAAYDEVMGLDLSSLEPLIACPSSPDNVRPVRELAGTPLAQVAIGSCTNSSYRDLMTAAAMLKGKRVPPGVSLVISPGSRQVLEMIAANGALADLIAAGARLLEVACGPCLGLGQAPATGTNSLRTFNRNFSGRSGTPNDAVYLAGVETAAASALAGKITDPRDLGAPIAVVLPDRYEVDEGLLVPPSEHPETVEIVRGPNIKPLPRQEPMPETLCGGILLKVGDNITTDHILPAGANVLPLRSNIPAIAEFAFVRVDPEFPERAKAAGGGFVIAGENYGQGSSREHAALAPRYLGLRAVIASSFARIHRSNLVNFGILPLVFANPVDYDSLAQGDEAEIPEVRRRLERGEPLVLRRRGVEIAVRHDLTKRQVRILLAGGLLNYVKEGGT